MSHEIPRVELDTPGNGGYQRRGETRREQRYDGEIRWMDKRQQTKRNTSGFCPEKKMANLGKYFVISPGLSCRCFNRDNTAIRVYNRYQGYRELFGTKIKFCWLKFLYFVIVIAKPIFFSLACVCVIHKNLLEWAKVPLEVAKVNRSLKIDQGGFWASCVRIFPSIRVNNTLMRGLYQILFSILSGIIHSRTQRGEFVLQDVWPEISRTCESDQTEDEVPLLFCKPTCKIFSH